MLRMGDHWMKNRFFLGMLNELPAIGSDGNILKNKNGKDMTMLDAYSAKNGELILDPRVDLEKSHWTSENQFQFSMKVQHILSGIHQEISPLGRAAAERNAIFAMALLFRKFIAPGVARRYKKKSYVERMGDYTEGYYRTTGRFLTNLIRDIKVYKTAVLSEDWGKLTKEEKANIVKTVNDLVFLVLAIAMVALLSGGDDDDDNWTKDFITYQMMRFQTEILFFTPKLDESWSILRSPFASMTLLQNVIDTFDQLAHPTERYQRGPWKGHLKYEKIMWNYVPVMRSLYQTRDIKNSMKFLE